MKNIFTLIKKEFSRFFKDRRMIITILLPGVLIYALYSVMGTAFTDMGKPDETYIPTAIIVDLPEELSAPLSSVFKLKFRKKNLLLKRRSKKLRKEVLTLRLFFLKLNRVSLKYAFFIIP